MCFHKKSLLGLLETVSGREQWYCHICKTIYLKERRKAMKITKGQTAIIVMGTAGVLGGLFLLNIVRVHPVQAILVALAGIGVGVGYYMYRRNKDK